MASARATADGAVVGTVAVRPAILARLGDARASRRGTLIGLLAVIAIVARTEVEAVTISLMGASGSGETSSQIENGGGLSVVGHTEIGHLRVELGQSVRVGGVSQFDVISNKASSSSGLNFVAIVCKLLEMGASVLPGIFYDRAHAPRLACFRH